LLFFIWTAASAQSNPAPFFLMGNGRMHIQNVQTNREAKVDLLLADGSLNESAFEQIDAVFGYRSRGKGDHISPRLIFMLNYFSNQVAPGRTIFLTSGYRSPEYNDGLRKAGKNAAKTSVHMDGLGLDFYIEGVRGKELWEIIRQKDCCGVGHYGGKEIHLDAARPRFWEAATSKVNTGESDYNRKMYLSTDLDRYRPGQNVRLSLSSISDFGFGVQKKAILLSETTGNNPPAEMEIQNTNSNDCLKIKDRTASRFISLNLPKDLKEGRYRIRLDFCQRPFEQMPVKIESNEIEVVSSVP
jgi:uncharacterized protein YcbK (DUF882 family)